MTKSELIEALADATDDAQIVFKDSAQGFFTPTTVSRLLPDESSLNHWWLQSGNT